MTLMIKVFVERRITTAMVFLGICLLGLISVSKLPVELLPDIELPLLTVITPMEGASPSEIEKLVTVKIEESVASVSGLAGMESESIEGISIVRASFRWGTNMDMALIEAKEKADLIKGELPQDTGKSVVVKYDPSSEPVMIYSITPGSGRSENLRRRVEKEIVPSIERIKGVALADIAGGDKREILVDLDNRALYSHNLSIHEVLQSIDMSNYSYPAGSIVKDDMEYLVRTSGEFRNLEDIRTVVAGYNENGVPVYLSRIAEIRDTYKEKKTEVRFNSSEGVALLIKKEPGKNTIDTCALVRDEIENLSQKQRGDFVFTLISDQSRFIEDAIRNVFISGFLGGVIAFFVLWFFLKSIVPPLIIALTIPVSVTGTLLLMHLFNVSINSMSLGGLALGVGMMVDAGIVVLESVTAAKEKNRDISPFEAACRGAEDVAAPLIASVLTSVVVFAPVIFLSGLAGALFRDLALSVSFALFFSLAASLTLIPMLAGIAPRFVERGKSGTDSLKERFYRGSDQVMEYLTSLYVKGIEYSIIYGKRVILCGITALAAGFLLMSVPEREVMPSVDPGEFVVKVEMPGGTKLNDTVSFCNTLEKVLLNTQGVARVFAKAGSDPDDSIADKISGRGADYGEIKVFISGRPSADIIEEIKENFIPGERVKLSWHIPGDLVSTLFSGAGDSLSVEIRGGDVREIVEAGNRVKELLGGFPGLAGVSSVFDRKAPELAVEIDRVKAASMGLSIEAAASAVSAAVKGEVSSRFREDDEEIDIRVRLRSEDRSSIESLNGIILKTDRGAVFPLSEIAEIREGSGSGKIVRKNQARVNSVTGEYEKNRAPDKDEAALRLKGINFTDGIEAAVFYGDNSAGDVLSSMLYAMLLAVVFIYMLLASQFQSLVNPLIIMLSIPVTVLGIALSLIVTGVSININSGIGIIMLCGIVVNNAIVLFDYIEKGRGEGLDVVSAVIEAGKRRLKPILMTTLTTVCALLPIAIGLGRGSELQRPLAVTVVGGLLFSTILTLIFIPALYTLLNRDGGKT